MENTNKNNMIELLVICIFLTLISILTVDLFKDLSTTQTNLNKIITGLRVTK